MKIFFCIKTACLFSFAPFLSALAPLIPESGCGISNLSTRCDPCAREFDVFAQLVVWTAKEAGADCWAEVLTAEPGKRSNTIHGVDFGWDPGFRVGVGTGILHDEWDTRAYYTWFYTKGTDSVANAPGTVHSSFLGNFYVNNVDGNGLSGPAYEKASIDWKIHFNMFDWELGRSFWVSGALAMRPFFMVKGGWIHQFIHSEWQNPDLSLPVYFATGIENLKNNFWGIGPGVGLNTKWNFFQNSGSFYLFGDFSAALMWGHWSFSDVFEDNLPQTIAIKVQPINGGATTVRTFMGFGWDLDCKERCYEISAKLGFETMVWLDQLQFYSFTGGRLVNELTLQGGTLELSFDF